MNRTDLKPGERDSYYNRYIDKVPSDLDLREGFLIGKEKVLNFFSSLPEEKHEYRYEQGKWSIKEVLQHLIDTERIFSYRCFRIARNDKTPLADFDQNIYMEPSGASNKSMDALLEEFRATRTNTITLLQSLTDADLERIGTSSGKLMSARSAAFTLLGHEIWHMSIVEEKY